MDSTEYQNLARRTQANQQKILERLVALGPQAMQLDNGARGLCGDAGEVASCIMRYIEYGQPLDRTNLIEEVGDCLWRLGQIADAAGFTLAEAMVANILKLCTRYPKEYTDAAAAHRDKEAELAALEGANKSLEDVGAALLQQKMSSREPKRGKFNQLEGVGHEWAEDKPQTRCVKCGAYRHLSSGQLFDCPGPYKGSESTTTSTQDGHGFGHHPDAPT